MAIYNIFRDNEPLSEYTFPNPPHVNVGYIFRVTSSIYLSHYTPPWTGSILGGRIYRSPSYTGSYTASLWRVSGSQLLAYKEIEPNTGSQWEYFYFDEPIPILLNTEYIISYRSYPTSSLLRNNCLSSSIWAPYFSFSSSIFNYTRSFSEINALAIRQGEGRYIQGKNTITFPTTSSNYWYGIDVLITGSECNYKCESIWNKLPSYAMRGNIYPTKMYISDPMLINGGYLYSGITKSISEGSPSPPSLQIYYPNTNWKFKWFINSGSRSISIRVKQQETTSSIYRPEMIIRKNPNLGIYNDISASAPNTSNWTTIGPLSVYPVKSGTVWVELWNRETSQFDRPCYFDHIVTT